jgi:hypothetical protein
MATTLKRSAVKPPVEWREVGERFEALGTDLRRHFAQVGKDTATQRAALEKAVEALVKDIEKMFVAAGETMRDPVLRKDVVQIGRAMRAAVRDTVRATDVRPGRTVVGAAKPAAKKAAAAGKRPARKPAARKPTHAG